MSFASWLRSTFTTQDPTTYKAAIDGNFVVVERVAAMFAAQQVSPTPNMTVAIRAGSIMDTAVLIEMAQQTTATITAPASTSRIDRIVIDQRTGVASVVTGAPSGSPVPPAIPNYQMPCAQILLQSTSTAITNSMITDERVFGSASDAYIDIYFAPITSPTFLGVPVGPTATALTNTTQLATCAFVTAAVNAGLTPSGSRAPWNQTAAPTGWTKDTTAALNDTAMRIVTGAVGSGGANAFSTAAYTPTITPALGTLATVATALTIAQMPSHTHIQKINGVNATMSGASGGGNVFAQTTFTLGTDEITAATGSGATHAHSLSGAPTATSSTITLNLKYNDFIIATKN
jgi:hypothetical protein